MQEKYFQKITHIYVIKPHISFLLSITDNYIPILLETSHTKMNGLHTTLSSLYKTNPYKHTSSSFSFCQTFCGVVYFKSLQAGNDIF